MLKRLKRLSYSLLSITLSCKDFQYSLSKKFIVCWSLSYSFSYLLFFFMNSLCTILLPNDKIQTIPAGIGKMIKPTPVIDKVIEVDVTPIITIVATDSKIMFRV